MRIIVGLGNPGPEYEQTRHNAGFMFLDYFAEAQSLRFMETIGNFSFARGILHGAPYLLIKPHTFMNNSGYVVSRVLLKNQVDPKDMMLIYDDLNLEIGKIKLKAKGSDGGHNGIASVIQAIKTEDFPRIRIGIGSRFEAGKMADFVLSRFTEPELKEINESYKLIKELTRGFIKSGVKGVLDLHSTLSSTKSKANKSENTDKSE